MSLAPHLRLACASLVVCSMACETRNEAPADDSVAETQSAVERDEGHVAAAVLSAAAFVTEGRRTFRHDTFGDEAFWGDTLKLHQAIAGEAQGGVDPGISPATALSLGLKVDVDALPAQTIAGLRRGTVDLQSPATTLALLRADAVVGVHGFFAKDGTLQ